MMRPIGGELEEQALLNSIYFTDSGRSSLRLFLRSLDHKDKKFLIPDFFCHVIEDVLKEENAAYAFYAVHDDFSLDMDSIKQQTYDVLYIIHYFGKSQSTKTLNLDHKIVIEDNVFFDDFNNKNSYKQWFAFNSYRKISSLSDGSMVKTNLLIDETLIEKESSGFAEVKESAKQRKYDYINNKEGTEKEYLALFREAENILDRQTKIFSVSEASLYRLVYRENATNQIVLKKRFIRAKKYLSTYAALDDVEHYAYFPIYVDDRDAVRKVLMKEGIFLPIHWPTSSQSHDIYTRIISIPLFSNYTESEFDYMIEKIKEVLDEKL